MNFQKHKSELELLFKDKPYQGQIPEKASIIFLSSDANYSEKILTSSFFGYIKEYHTDGPTFCKKYKCHHPFLLKEYPFNKTKDGVPYHRNIDKLALGLEHVCNISFLELLDVPTIGNRSENKFEFYNLLSDKHLLYIEKLIFGGRHKLFLISRGVLKDLAKIRKKKSLFDWLDFKSLLNWDNIFINGNKIKPIYHPSSSQIHSQIDEIRKEILEWLN